MHSHKILNIPSPQKQLRDSLSKELGVSRVLIQVLLNRGFKAAGQIESFLNPKLEDLIDPYSFSQMPQAVEIIKRAIRDKKKIVVFGDYDVDGVTSLSLLKNALAKIGPEPLHYLPHRVKEGYGLNKAGLKFIKENKTGLLITVDCGTNSQEEIESLRRLGIEVIITDHHEPLENYASSASALINPKLKDSGYKYRDLAGVGVAYKLSQAITREALFEELDLVSLGTIADMVPLTGENRIIAKEGLARLSRSRRPGLRALMSEAGIADKDITSGFVSFILGPRLNASGRMDSAEASLRLLMSDDEAEAAELAKTIQAHNRLRQKVEAKILEEAQSIIEKEINFKEHKIIVVAKEDWHPGVLGIVASKLTDRFYRPAVVISKTENFCKGSARSIKNFHLFNALSGCAHLLEDFGGHAHAAGLLIAKESIEEFRANINRLAQQTLTLEDLLPSIDIDMEVSLAELNEEVVLELSKLGPAGAGNPEPLFYSRSLKLKGPPQTLNRNTLKFWASDGNTTFAAIGFGMSSLCDSLLNADSFDLVYTPRLDNWQDQESILLEVEDIFFR
jgi:single-stranded-DNA-specific exonuclease